MTWMIDRPVPGPGAGPGAPSKARKVWKRFHDAMTAEDREAARADMAALAAEAGFPLAGYYALCGLTPLPPEKPRVRVPAGSSPAEE